MSDSQGDFVWYDLLTTDVNGAKAFYGDVIGWRTQAFEGGGSPYTMWTVGETPLGGVMPLPDEARKAGAPPHWTAYVFADDVDALTEKATALGGTICVPPTDIPTVGRFSAVADPQGAKLSLFTAKGPGMPRAAEGTPGHFAWHELLTDDWEAAFRFYSLLFGWEKGDTLDMGAMGTYQLYGRGGRTLGGMMTRPPGYPAPPHWLYYVTVADLDAAIERVKRLDGKLWNGPMVVPGGQRIAQCADPQGGAFALVGE